MSKGVFVIDGEELAADNPSEGRQLVVSSGEAPIFVPGRRSWVKYRELGVTEASQGSMRAQVIHAGTDNQPTGWHFHRCDMPFLYVVEGAITIAFNSDRIIRLAPGDSIMIPGGTIHMEAGAPEGVQVIEVSIPSAMSTENVEAPWPADAIDFAKARRPSEFA